MNTDVTSCVLCAKPELVTVWAHGYQNGVADEGVAFLDDTGLCPAHLAEVTQRVRGAHGSACESLRAFDLAQREQRRARVEIMWSTRAPSVARGHLCDVVIVPARYGGVYEGADWLAWIGERDWLDESDAGDVECPIFWSDYKAAPIGRGRSPCAALEDLERVCKAGREAFKPWEPPE